MYNTELWVGRPSDGTPRIQFFDSYILELWCQMDFQNYPRDKQVDIKKYVHKVIVKAWIE